MKFGQRKARSASCQVIKIKFNKGLDNFKYMFRNLIHLYSKARVREKRGKVARLKIIK